MLHIVEEGRKLVATTQQLDEGAVEGARMWRDPWVFRHHRTEEYHAPITARTIEGPPDGRGVIGHAATKARTTADQSACLDKRWMRS